MTSKEMEKKVAALIESLWEDAAGNPDGDCDECKHFSCHDEHHPYGMGTATERLCECTVPDAKDCPVVEEIIRALDAAVHAIIKEEARS